MPKMVSRRRGRSTVAILQTLPQACPPLGIGTRASIRVRQVRSTGATSSRCGIHAIMPV